MAWYAWYSGIRRQRKVTNVRSAISNGAQSKIEAKTSNVELLNFDVEGIHILVLMTSIPQLDVWW